MAPDGCGEMHLLIQADIDGELRPAEAARVAGHLEDCTACTRLQARLLALRSEVQATMSRYAAPEALRAAVAAKLAVRAVPSRAGFKMIGVPALSFAFGAALAACLALVMIAPQQSGLGEDVVAAHIRALQPGHLMDVVSTDQHTVKPWFDGRLPFAPPVKELAAAGYRLDGGRLDYLHGHTAAVLVYRAGQHLIDLFTWPSDTSADRPVTAGTDEGYNYIRWATDGMSFWAVSDLNRDELRDFVAKWQRE